MTEGFLVGNSVARQTRPQLKKASRWGEFEPIGWPVEHLHFGGERVCVRSRICKMAKFYYAVLCPDCVCAHILR